MLQASTGQARPCNLYQGLKGDQSALQLFHNLQELRPVGSDCACGPSGSNTWVHASARERSFLHNLQVACQSQGGVFIVRNQVVSTTWSMIAVQSFV